MIKKKGSCYLNYNWNLGSEMERKRRVLLVLQINVNLLLPQLNRRRSSIGSSSSYSTNMYRIRFISTTIFSFSGVEIVWWLDSIPSPPRFEFSHRKTSQSTINNIIIRLFGDSYFIKRNRLASLLSLYRTNRSRRTLDNWNKKLWLIMTKSHTVVDKVPQLSGYFSTSEFLEFIFNLLVLWIDFCLNYLPCSCDQFTNCDMHRLLLEGSTESL